MVTPNRPTTGMLFSDWHATMHDPQPMQLLRSMVMPHLWPSYFQSGKRLRSGGCSTIFCAKSGDLDHLSSVVSRTMGRPSMALCSCVRASGRFWLLFCTVAPTAMYGADE